MNEPSRSNPQDHVILQGITDAGIDLKQMGARTSQEERDRARAHIEDMRARGYLKDEDASLRIGYVDESETRQQILAAIIDLPPLPEPKKKISRSMFISGIDSYFKKFDYSEPAYYIPLHILGMMLSMLVAVSPFIILGALGLSRSVLMLPCGLAGVLIGVIGFIANIVAMFMAADP
jgi:hypothetical protein